MSAVMVVAGTRPEIIKMAPVIRVLQKNKIPMKFVHCGQHYDYNMAQQFIEDLELSPPDYTFEVKGYSPGVQTAQIIMKIDELMKKMLSQLSWLKVTQTQCWQQLWQPISEMYQRVTWRLV